MSIMNDGAYRELKELEAHYLDEPESTLYPYRVRVEITQYYDVDVEAESEEAAYAEASAVIYNEEFPLGAELYDEAIEFVSCEEL